MDGQMNIRATLDISELERNAARYGKAVRQMGVETDQQGTVMSTAWTRIKQAAGAYLTLDIVKRIATTRGEFQSLNVAFTTMLGDGAKAQKLMAEAVELAAKTPFSLQDVATGAKQLLAYGFAAEDITGTLKRLGDVASAMGLPIERLTYLYGTTATQGRLFARDMIQFTTSGIPVLGELAKMYGVTTEEINTMVTAGKIGFDDVKKVFENMTNEGGRFYNLMEETSKTITGKISNLGDALAGMFNNIGQANEGIINGAIDGAKYLVENYEKVGEILAELVAAYGIYRTTLIMVAATQKITSTAKQTAEAEELTKLLTIEQRAVISKQNLTKGTIEHTAAIKSEITAEMERHTAIAASLNTEISSTIEAVALRKEQHAASIKMVETRKAELAATIEGAKSERIASLEKEMAINAEKQSRAALRVLKLQEQKDSAISEARALKEAGSSAEIVAAKNREIAAINAKLIVAKQEEIQYSKTIVAKRAEVKTIDSSIASKKIEAAQNKLNVALQEANTAEINKNSAARALSSKRSALDSAVRRANTLETGLNTAATKANTTAHTIMGAAMLKVSQIANKLKAAIAGNIWTIAAAAIAALAYGIYKLATYTTDAEDAVQRVTDANKEFEKSIGSEQMAIDRLFGKLKSATAGTAEYEKVKKDILSKYGQYLEGLSAETKSLNNVADAYRAISEAAKQSARDRAIEASAKKASDAYMEIEVENLTKIKKLMEEKFGTMNGTIYFDQLRKEIEAGKGLSEEMKAVIEKFNENIYIASPSGPATTIQANNIDAYISRIQKGKNVLKTEIDEINAVLGNIAPQTPKSLEALNTELSIATKKLEELKQVRPTIFTEEEITKQEAYIVTLNGAIKAQKAEEKATADKNAEIKKSVEWYEAEIKTLKESQEASTTKKEYTGYQKQIDALEKEKQAITGETKKRNAEIEGLEKEISQKIIENDLKLQSERLSILEDGRTKQIALIELETKEKLAAIDKEQQELADEYKKAGKGNLSEEVRGKFDERRASTEAISAKQRFDIEYKYNVETEKMYEELSDVFLTEEERKKKAVQQRYDEMRRVALEEYNNEVSSIKSTKTEPEAKKAIEEETVKYQEKSALIDSAQIEEQGRYYLDQVKTIKEKELDIINKYNPIIAAAESAGQKEKSEQAKQERDTQLLELQASQEDFYKVLFGELEDYSSAAVISAIKNATQYIDNYEKSIKATGRKLSPEEIAALAKIKKATTEAETSVRNRIPQGLKSTAAALNECVSLAAQFDSNLANTIQTVSTMIEGFGDIKQGINDFNNILEKQKEAKAGNTDGGAAGITDIIGSIGSYAGAAGAVIGGVSKIVGVFTGFAKQAKMAKQEVEKFYMTAYLGEKSYQAILRQRDYDLASATKAQLETAKIQEKYFQEQINKMGTFTPRDTGRGFLSYIINKREEEEFNKNLAALKQGLASVKEEVIDLENTPQTTWAQANKQVELLQKNILEAIKDNTELFQKLSQEEYISGEHTKSRFLGMGTKVVKEWSSLAGKSAEEIENLYSQGKLSDESKAIYEEWKKSGEELDEWSNTFQDVQDHLNEMATGTSLGSFVDDFANMLSQGMTSVEDFAGFTEDTLKNAILSSFKYKVIEGALSPLYDKLADMFTGDQFPTPDQIDQFSKEMNDKLPGLALQLDGIFDKLGITMAENKPNAQTGAISESITEQTASELKGLTRGSYDTLKGIDQKVFNFHEDYKSTMMASNALLANIAVNTGNSATNTTEMLSEIKSLRVDVQSLKDTRKFV